MVYPLILSYYLDTFFHKTPDQICQMHRHLSRDCLILRHASNWASSTQALISMDLARYPRRLSISKHSESDSLSVNLGQGSFWLYLIYIIWNLVLVNAILYPCMTSLSRKWLPSFSSPRPGLCTNWGRVNYLWVRPQNLEIMCHQKVFDDTTVPVKRSEQTQHFTPRASSQAWPVNDVIFTNFKGKV